MITVARWTDVLFVAADHPLIVDRVHRCARLNVHTVDGMRVRNRIIVIQFVRMQVTGRLKLLAGGRIVQMTIANEHRMAIVFTVTILGSLIVNHRHLTARRTMVHGRRLGRQLRIVRA